MVGCPTVPHPAAPHLHAVIFLFRSTCFAGAWTSPAAWIMSSTLTSPSTQLTTCIVRAALRAPVPRVRGACLQLATVALECIACCAAIIKLLQLRWDMRCNRRVHKQSPATLPCLTSATLAGKITSLVGKGDRVLAERIEDALQRGLPLDSLSANKAVLPAHMR